MYLTVEIEIDEKGILAQIERTQKAQSKLSSELYELGKMLQHSTKKEKGDSEESPEKLEKEYVTEWCHKLAESFQAGHDSREESEQ